MNSVRSLYKENDHVTTSKSFIPESWSVILLVLMYSVNIYFWAVNLQLVDGNKFRAKHLLIQKMTFCMAICILPETETLFHLQKHHTSRKYSAVATESVPVLTYECLRYEIWYADRITTDN
jgi:hypothetical protein